MKNEPSTFKKEYAETEISFFIEGRVTITGNGETAEIKTDDLATFYKGLNAPGQFMNMSG